MASLAPTPASVTRALQSFARTGAAQPLASVRKSSAGGPWLRIKQSRDHTDVALTVQLAPGQWFTFSVRVDHTMIRRVLQRYGVEYEIGFSLGGLWKGIKKIAKATGVSKVLKTAASVLKNPIVTAVFPVASIAARATEAGVMLMNAATKAKKGTPKEKAEAVQLIKAAHAKAKGGDPVAQKALKVASRAYRIVVMPLEAAA